MSDNKPLHRRDFVKVTAAAATAAALSACSRSARPLPTPTSGRPAATQQPPTSAPSPTAQPTPAATTAPNPIGRVALVRTEDRADGIHRALDLLDLNPVRGKSLFVKPNLNSADPFPGSTHPDTLLSMASELKAMGAEHLTVGDRSGMGDTRAVMRAKGILTMADELGWSTMVLDELGSDDWVRFAADAGHWQAGFALPGPVLAFDGIVQTCCLKTHRYGGHFTISLKNSVGLAAKRVPGEPHDYMTELHNSIHQRRMIAEINSAYAPDLVILDAMEAFVNGGPDYGTKVKPGVILAAADRVALDAVGVAILRYFGTTADVASGPIFDQQQIRRAADLGLGAAGPDQIDIITGDDDSRDFTAPLLDVLAYG
jgi:uncharacterized protein (DUF362 family)